MTIASLQVAKIKLSVQTAIHCCTHTTETPDLQAEGEKTAFELEKREKRKKKDRKQQ
jgi:hypothetical protein